jgi:drug/metabolite transporter superfamily protein YnfA
MRWIADVTVMLLAALLEVGGDAVIRAGLRGRAWLLVALGAVVLAGYGVVVNLLPMDFSRLLPGYVAFFALGSVTFGRLVFHEAIPVSTWVGVGLMLAGSACVQLGAAR